MQLHEETIFNEALDIADERARQTFLDKACGGDEELRSKIQRLLQAYPQGDALEPDCPEIQTEQDTPSSLREQVGDKIGRYKLLEQLGEGGMGIVYMAEQTKPVRRKVALKIIKVGMDTGQVIARFEAERQALALMNHPNIAGVLDAGETETGRPYFVMELVRGIPITEFCDQQQLTNQQRLELFINVCEAVQHAHQKGIIHRDLKPSNVLVELHDIKAVPKIIDFGIAKATNQQLTERTLFTQFSQMIGTPMYMSPEQAQLSGLDIDTRSDIYSLGVLLYELLTGSPPFDRDTFKAATFDEIRRIIREDEPQLPSHRVSTLQAKQRTTVIETDRRDLKPIRRNVERELDWIVMKALEKDRTRRYDSASAFSRDVQRHLSGEIVYACPPSLGYRLGKFAKRNRRFVAAMAPLGVGIPLAIGLLWNERNQTLAALTRATSQEQLVQQQKQKAEEHTKQARISAAEAIEQRNAASWNQYCAEILSGQIDAQQGNVVRLEQKLVGHLPLLDQKDRRGWEWYYLFSICHPETRTLISNVSSHDSNATWSPDGTYIARAGAIFDAETGDCIRRLIPSRNLVKEGAWSPDSKMYAWGTSSDDSCIYLWNRISDELAELRGLKSSVWCVDWSPDGKLLASGGIDKEVWVWDVAARKPVKKLKVENNVTCVAWSPDGDLLAAGVKWNDLMVWDPRSGKLLAHHEALSTRREGGGGYSVRLSWHPNGEQLAVSTPKNWFLLRRSDWTVMHKEDREQHYGHARGYDIAWRPDGKRIAITDKEFVSVFDPNDPETKPALYGPTKFTVSLEWRANSQQFVTSDAIGDIKIWDLNSSMQPSALSTGNGVQSLSWLADSETVFAVDAIGRTTSYWSALDGRPLKVEAPLSAGQTHWSPDRRLAAVLSDAEPEDIRILNGTSGLTHSIWKRDDPADEVTGISWSKDGTRLAIRKNRGPRTSVEFWDVDHEKRISQWNHRGVPASADISIEAAWSSDGNRIAVAALGEAHDSGVPAFRPHVYIVDVLRGATDLKYTLAAPRGSIVTSLDWSPDNRAVIVGSSHGTVDAFDVDSWQTRFSNRISRTPIRSVDWSPDGRRIVSAAEDGTVIVFAAHNGDDLLRFRLDDGAQQVTWSPNGVRLAAASEGGEIHVWDAAKGYEFSETGDKRGELAWTYFRALQQKSTGAEESRLRQALRLAPDTLGFWELRGHAYAELGDLDSASLEFSKAMGRELRTSFFATESYGFALLGAGQREMYRRHCVRLLNVFANTEVPSLGGRVAWLCALLENDQFDASKLVRLAQADAGINVNDGLTGAEYGLGAALYRNRQYKSANALLTAVVDRLETSRNPTGRGELASSLYFLAMVRARMNQRFQAARLLADGDRIAKEFHDTISWYQNVQLKVLGEEARKLIVLDADVDQ